MDQEHQNALRRPLVLVVDDHLDTRDMYCQVLEVFGYATDGAGDGFEALDKARAAVPDVILTDIGLPKMDGMELCGRLKADAHTAHIPVIALTGFGEATVAERARNLGIAKVLVKPCAPDLLLEEIRSVCSGRTKVPQGR